MFIMENYEIQLICEIEIFIMQMKNCSCQTGVYNQKTINQRLILLSKTQA